MDLEIELVKLDIMLGTTLTSDVSAVDWVAALLTARRLGDDVDALACPYLNSHRDRTFITFFCVSQARSIYFYCNSFLLGLMAHACDDLREESAIGIP